VKILKKGTATRIVSLTLGAVVLAAFIYYVGLGNLERVLLQVNPALIVVMVGTQLLGFTFYAVAWYLLIRASGYKLPFLTCQGITFASIFASYTMPSGIFLEGVRCILGSKESGMSIGESTATVILHRILYVIGFLASTALAFLFLATNHQEMNSVLLQIIIVPVTVIVGLIVVVYLSFNPRKLLPLLDRALKLAKPLVKIIQAEEKTDGKAAQFLDDYHTSFRRMLSSKDYVMFSFASSLADWACSVLVLWVVLIALGFVTSIWVVIATMAVGKLIQMTPISVPGMLGIYETVITASLALLGTPVATAASAAILSRIVTSWLDIPLTGIAAYHYGYKTFSQLIDTPRGSTK
jgi:uncharacterized protein (TIRG00374 family)